MASDYLLKIDGIEGESDDSKLKGTIEIQSFSWGNSNTGTFAAGGGGGAGKVSFQDMHFTARVSKASPILMLNCAKSHHISKATFYVRKGGGEQREFYTINLEDLLVSSYQSGGSEGGDSLPIDQFSLNFAKIKFEYQAQASKGHLGGAVTGTWDQKINKVW